MQSRQKHCTMITNPTSSASELSGGAPLAPQGYSGVIGCWIPPLSKSALFGCVWQEVKSAKITKSVAIVSGASGGAMDFSRGFWGLLGVFFDLPNQFFEIPLFW